MDFDKLKKAAKETLKIMSAKEPFTDEEEDDFPEVAEETESDASTGEKDDLMGSTQRIDFKTIFEKFRAKAEDAADAAGEHITRIKLTPDTMDELAKTVDEIDKRTEEITIAADENSEKLSASIVTLKSEFDASFQAIRDELSGIRKSMGSAASQTDDLFNSVITKLNNSEKRIEKLTNSLSGVSKLNDSIFDLKNTQSNMRNTLNDLEESFYNLKKKMTFGVIMLSVIAAIVAILEIVNLLS